MKIRMFLLLALLASACMLSVPRAAYSQNDKDCTNDTLWSTKNFWPEEIKVCRFTPDGKYVLATVGKTLCKFDALTGELVSRFKDNCDDKIILMEFSSRNLSQILTLDYLQEAIYIWDYNLEKIITKMVIKNDSIKGVACVAINNDNKYVFIGRAKSNDNQLLIYDVINEKVEKLLTIPGLISIAISPDNQFFVTAALDYNEMEDSFYSHLSLWKTESWEYVKELGYIKSRIINLNYSQDGKLLTCGRDDEPLTVWNMESLIKIMEYTREKTGQAHFKAKFTPDSRYIVLSSGPPPRNLTTLLWDYVNDTLICKYNYSSDDLDVNQIGDNIILTNILKLISIKPKLKPSSKIDYSKENPFLKLKYINNLLNISLSSALPAFYKLEIYDNSGKMITEVNLGYLEKGDHIFTRTIQLSSGVYFAVLKFANQSISKQFEVVR